MLMWLQWSTRSADDRCCRIPTNRTSLYTSRISCAQCSTSTKAGASARHQNESFAGATIHLNCLGLLLQLPTPILEPMKWSRSLLASVSASTPPLPTLLQSSNWRSASVYAPNRNWGRLLHCMHHYQIVTDTIWYVCLVTCWTSSASNI